MLGRAIEAARKDAGLTQKELADLAGVSEDTVGRVEGLKSNIRFTALVSIARALGFEPALLKMENTLSGGSAPPDPWDTMTGDRNEC